MLVSEFGLGVYAEYLFYSGCCAVVVCGVASTCTGGEGLVCYKVDGVLTVINYGSK